MNRLRVVYMGTPDFSVPALQTLIDNHTVVGVVSNPDRPSGRGKKMHAPPVKKLAVEHGIDVLQPKRLRKNDKAFEHISAWNADVAVVAAYGQILPQRFLDIPRLGCVNIHASLLPKLRGAAPINWAIVRGESESGVTTMQMEAGLDTGPMLLQESVAIGELDTAQVLHDALSELGANLIIPTIAGLHDGSITPIPQNDDASTYAPMMSKADGKIDWEKPAREVADLIRGMNPWPGAYAAFEEKTTKFHLAQVVDGSGEPGTVLDTKNDLVIACGSGAVSVLEIQAAGSKRMRGVDFVNGFRLSPGARFH